MIGICDLFHATAERNTYQIVTIIKHFRTNACYAVWYNHARQPAATGKRRRPYARHAVRDRHARQTTAIVERTIPDTRYTVDYHHARQATTAVERIVLYACHIVRNNKIRNQRTI